MENEKWIDEIRKKIMMKGRSCPICSSDVLRIKFPMIFYEKESKGKELIFKCSCCKLNAVGTISKEKKPIWFYIRKGQALIESFV